MKWINVGELTFNLFLIICVVKYQPIRKSLIRGVWEQLTSVNYLLRIKYLDTAAKRDL